MSAGPQKFARLRFIDATGRTVSLVLSVEPVGWQNEQSEAAAVTDLAHIVGHALQRFAAQANGVNGLSVVVDGHKDLAPASWERKS